MKLGHANPEISALQALGGGVSFHSITVVKIAKKCVFQELTSAAHYIFRSQKVNFDMLWMPRYTKNVTFDASHVPPTHNRPQKKILIFVF